MISDFRCQHNTIEYNDILGITVFRIVFKSKVYN